MAAMAAAAAARAVLCVCLWLAVCQVQGHHLPPRMNRTIQNLLQHYKLKNTDIFNQKPVFSKEPFSAQMEAKVVFMGGVLDVYEELITNMLKQLPTPCPQTAGSDQPTAAPAAAGTAGEAGAGSSVRAELEYLLEMVKSLKDKRYQEQGKFLKELRALKDIPMDDAVVQGKALGELPWMFEEASVLFKEIKLERRRRRRQAWRAKTHLRA